MEVCHNNELTAQTKYTDCVHGNIKHFQVSNTHKAENTNAETICHAFSSLEIHRCVQKANVGRNKCQQRYAVWYSLIKSYFSDDHIPTFSSPKSRRPYSLERFRMHILASLLSNFSKQFKHLKHQPFLSSSNVQNSVSHSVRVNNFKPVLSKRFLSSSNLQNIVSNSARMLHFASLF